MAAHAASDVGDWPMSERGIAEICRDADGVTQLSQGAVLSRSQSKDQLRGPDRSPSRESAVARDHLVDDVDIARMEEYALLSALLLRPPDAALLRDMSAIRADSTEFGRAHAGLAQAAETTNPQRLEREYFNLFIGLGRGELLPYGSYYLTGFLHDRPLARLRGDLAEIGVARAEQHYEPEDHIAILCEIMAGLAGGRFVAPEGSERRIFELHLAPWAGRFFADLEAAPGAPFYRHVGRVGGLFMDIETKAFALLD
jgi:TorA maturation chaperone TorD